MASTCSGTPVIIPSASSGRSHAVTVYIQRSTPPEVNPTKPGNSATAGNTLSRVNAWTIRTSSSDRASNQVRLSAQGRVLLPDGILVAYPNDTGPTRRQHERLQAQLLDEGCLVPVPL